MKTPTRRGDLNRLAPFPFSSMFQNGPRPQGSAPENLCKPTKDSPPPRTPRAPLTAAGRSEDFPTRRERGQMQTPNHAQLPAPACLPLLGAEPTQPGALVFRNIRIRPPPVDDVNNLRHDGKSQRCLASAAIQIRRNALFTSPEYANSLVVSQERRLPRTALAPDPRLRAWAIICGVYLPCFLGL